MVATPVRIIVVDDSPLYRGTICNMLEKHPNVQVVAEAGDGRYAVQAVNTHRPDIVLMDITMPFLDGIEATRIIKYKFPETNVIVFTMYIDESYSDKALQAGACRFITKDCDKEELLKAIMDCSNIPLKVVEHSLDELYPLKSPNTILASQHCALNHGLAPAPEGYSHGDFCESVIRN